MIFKNKYSRCPELNINVKIDDKSIEQVNTTKFLGILIENKFNWHDHTTHVSNIISKYNGIIRKISHFLPPHSLATLYNTLVYPYLMEPSSGLIPTTLTEIQFYFYKRSWFVPVQSRVGLVSPLQSPILIFKHT